jgi:SUKH-3 immunity protein of toxin-antitoxin system
VTRSYEHDWSEGVRRTLRNAGWYPRRRVDIAGWRDSLAPEGFELHAGARDFLKEFGGLAVNVRGPGRDHARISFVLNPLRCSGQKKWFDSLAGPTAGQLYPVGEERDGNASLAIDASGIVYTLFNSQIKRIGTGPTALARLIEGVEAPGDE